MGTIIAKRDKKAQKGGKMAQKKQTERKRFSEKATAYRHTAAICGVSENMVRKVMDGSRSNDEIEVTYLTLLDGTNKLIEAVKKAVPFLPDERNPITRVEVRVWNEFIND